MRRALDLGGARLSRRRARAQLLEGQRPGEVHELSATTKRSTAFGVVARSEGILPALESSHAVAKAIEIARRRRRDEVVVVCLSGRGDKDAAEIARLRGEQY